MAAMTSSASKVDGADARSSSFHRVRSSTSIRRRRSGSSAGVTRRWARTRSSPRCWQAWSMLATERRRVLQHRPVGGLEVRLGGEIVAEEHCALLARVVARRSSRPTRRSRPAKKCSVATPVEPIGPVPRLVAVVGRVESGPAEALRIEFRGSGEGCVELVGRKELETVSAVPSRTATTLALGFASQSSFESVT